MMIFTDWNSERVFFILETTQKGYFFSLETTQTGYSLVQHAYPKNVRVPPPSSQYYISYHSCAALLQMYPRSLWCFQIQADAHLLQTLKHIIVNSINKHLFFDGILADCCGTQFVKFFPHDTHPAGDVTRVPRKVIVKIRDAENWWRGCRDENRLKRAKNPVRLVLSPASFKSQNLGL